MNPAFLPLLTFAVIEDLNEVRKMSHAELRAASAGVVDRIAGSADWIIRDEQPRGGRRGREEYRQLWRSMVRGVALASMLPGGVTLFGTHFDATKWPFCGPGLPGDV